MEVLVLGVAERPLAWDAGGAEVEVRVQLEARTPEGGVASGVEGASVYLRDAGGIETDLRRQAALREACGEALASASARLSRSGEERDGQGER